ncbi:AER244Cp [Eremothecium gossypii ATCC 10895]|uniref:Chromatin modification-related protein EAF1 n=1 Tax=Eremothecium gossypii (strain ATCC 10895 / CBS 109.51 / FGSC 9923 / NRRL Y-1056) TaxID=284811 RepID=EAF1_EREGS|nr:AER244Cp [Eremothecium gossypii ATCC 10895]Q756L0.2 RecName: Full=Chromatin modification-related protein EAF1; AltName: Full=ESA1-associated factor 1; AltName: Full=Vacuolar import and degradation protein 21 [Eremothecium gossypii ATCC 10895]AAS52925.2 AER244Cp [Eremothecium gossypii ATCC 10895]AEY97233.1 FAER244Cp [Eremothecium gossypii FDAG1]
MSVLKKDSTSEKRTQLESILEERNNKLTQLFWLSRLNELKSGGDLQSVRQELAEFLVQNDLTKNLTFDISSLRTYRPQEPPMDRRPLRSKSSTPLENGTINRKREDAEPHMEETRKRLREHIIPEEDDDREHEQRPVKLQKVGLSHDEELPKRLEPPTIPIRKISSAGDNQETGSVIGEKKSEQPVSTSRNRPIHTQLSTNPFYQHMDISTLRAEPTPVEVKRKRNYIIDEIIKTQSKSTDTSDSHSTAGGRDSVYLVMKETVPSKLARAIPLSELKYVSQTLPLIRLIPPTHKALTTDLYNTALNEGRITVVSSRIEELRRLNLWSLRQPKKFLDPWRQKQPSTHRGYMLEEARWMREDFHEFKKFKVSVCAVNSKAIMDYWKYGKACCIKRRSISHLQKSVNEVQEADTLGNIDDLLNKISDKKLAGMIEEQKKVIAVDAKLSSSKIAPSEEIHAPHIWEDPLDELDEQGCKPIFKTYMSYNGVSPLEKTILEDLPIYKGILDEQAAEDNSVPFVPISKSTVLLDDDYFMKLIEKDIVDDEPSFVALSKRRGMFYGNRRSHYLKPPSAPALRYLKFRTPTIWSPEDDQELVKNINQYAYNWDLIGALVSSSNGRSYISNIERRTPWQCFERFVQLNEKFSVHDMKGPRANAAQMWLYEAHKLQQQQKRRISPLGVGSESIQRGHRRLRWATMFEAMRKTIKKRENAPRPNPSQPRKPLDVKSAAVPTPAEMSELKAQRDETLRREGQMRRAAKQRIHLAQLQQQQQRVQQDVVQQRPQSRSQPDPPLSQQIPRVQSPRPQQPLAQQLIEDKGKLLPGVSVSAPTSKEASNNGKNLMALRQVQSSPVNGDLQKATAQVPPRGPNKPLTEKEIIESYARKIIAQKPDFTPELALKAAESYYQNVTLKQNTIGKQIVSQPLSAATVSTPPSNGRAVHKIRSPTPQEILQRIQQKKNDS